jgi:hypothetical protein
MHQRRASAVPLVDEGVEDVKQLQRERQRRRAAAATSGSGDERSAMSWTFEAILAAIARLRDMPLNPTHLKAAIGVAGGRSRS